MPKDATKLPPHDFMEQVFGKRIMEEVDKVVAERSEGALIKDKSDEDRDDVFIP